MKCHFCNSDIPDGSTKCPKCGFDLPESEEENKTPQKEIENSQENSEPEEDLTPYKKKNYGTVSSFKSSFKHKSVASYSAKLERQRKKEEEERERLEEESLNQDKTSQSNDDSSYSSSFKTSSSTFNYGYNHENSQNIESTKTPNNEERTKEEAKKEEPKSYFESSKFHYERADFSHKDYSKSYEESVKDTHNNTSLDSSNVSQTTNSSSSTSLSNSATPTTNEASTNKTTPTQDLTLNKVKIPEGKHDDSRTLNSTINDKSSLEVKAKINENINEANNNVTLETKTQDETSSSSNFSIETTSSQGLTSIFRRKNKNSNKDSSNYEDKSSGVVLDNNTYNSNTSNNTYSTNTTNSTYTPNTYNPTNTTNDTYNPSNTTNNTYNPTSTTSSPTYNTNNTYSSNTTYNPNTTNNQDSGYDVSFTHPKDTDSLENSNLFKANPVYDNTYVFKHDDLNEVQNVPNIDFYNIYFEEEFSKKIPENVKISYIAKNESLFQNLINLWKDPDTYQKFQGAMGRSAQTFIVVDALSLMFNINYLAAFLFELPLLFNFVKNLKAVSFEKNAQKFRNFLIEFIIHGVFFIGLLSYFNSMYDVDADADTKLYCAIIQWVLVADAIYLQAKTAFKFYKFYPRITQMKKLVIYFFDIGKN